MSSNPIEVIPSNDATMSEPEAGLKRQVMCYSPSMMLVRHLQKKGWVGTKHSHPHEQMVYVISGRIVSLLIVSTIGALVALSAIWWFFSR